MLYMICLFFCSDAILKKNIYINFILNLHFLTPYKSVF